MEKLIIITPHMSTGGCPQVVLKRIEMLRDFYEIYCIEYSFLSPDYTVQRNKVINLISNRFIPIFRDGNKIIDIINNIKPDIVFIEEISETFIDLEVCKEIYKKDRSYKLIESTHGSDDKSDIKRHLPDKFVFVSEWSKRMYSHFNIPIDVVEYPVDFIKRDKQNTLNFEEGYKHVLNIGLFTPGKNQKYIFEIANLLKEEKIKFHFVGNLAQNFSDYWQPLLKNKPDNCIVWGEKNNIEDYFLSCDLFLFTSLHELNPLVIKESIGYGIPTLMFNLETYCNNYDSVGGISFLTGEIEKDIKKIKDELYA